MYREGTKMKGSIEKIMQHAGSDNEFGFISGDDGNKYYFDSRSIPAGYSTHDFYEGDMVEFGVIPQSGRDKDMATNLRLLEVPDTSAAASDSAPDSEATSTTKIQNAG